MTLRRPNKSVYKVYVKSKDKYYSRSRSKSTWTTLKWALFAAAAACKYHKVKTNDIEIHEFPVADAIKHSYLALLTAEKEANKEREEKRKMAKLKEEKLNQIRNAKETLKRSKEQIKIATEFLKSEGFDPDTFSDAN